MPTASRPQPNDPISVCICTYKRPDHLARLLRSLAAQELDDEMAFGAIVVDNDPEASARETAETIRDDLPFELQYVHEPEPGIVAARNTSVRVSSTPFIAFIDDDEFADRRWLATLQQAFFESDADAVLGPVRPHFENHPPRWLVKSGVCERDEFPTGTRITDSRHTRTGNVLISRETLDAVDGPFDSRYGGKLGGSDAAFFKQAIGLGKKLYWCNEAVVWETVVPKRQQRGYYLRRALARGRTAATLVPFLSFQTVKSIVALVLYSVSLPFLAFTAHHLFMKYLIKDCDHIGRMLAYLGIRVVNERPY